MIQIDAGDATLQPNAKNSICKISVSASILFYKVICLFDVHLRMAKIKNTKSKAVIAVVKINCPLNTGNLPSPTTFIKDGFTWPFVGSLMSRFVHVIFKFLSITFRIIDGTIRLENHF